MEPCVHFSGRVDHQALPGYYCAADLLALPSDYESFGLVVLEALACGTPVAATRVGIAPDLIEAGVNGILLENNSRESLVRGIEGLTMGARLPVEPIRSSVAPYDWQGVAAAMTDVYISLLKGQNR